MEKSNHINMDKASLKKLSKSQLIKLLLKEEKPEKKQKVIYNHENLFDDTERNVMRRVKSDPFEKTMNDIKKKKRKIDEESININTKYQNLISSEEKIRNYPMIETSLHNLRNDEKRRSSSKNKAKMSFLQLFEERLDHIQGEREIVSINLDVEIDTNKSLTEEYLKITPEMIENEEDDEYKMKYKNIIKQSFRIVKYDTLFDKNLTKTVIRKRYGSFTVEIPVNLSRFDVYKFAMYTYY